MKLKHILIPVITLLLCSFIKLQHQDKKIDTTEFSETCMKISNEYKTQNEHGNVFNNKTKKFLSLPAFSKILKNISKYDVDKNIKYKVEQNHLGNIERTIWKNSTKKSNLLSIKKLTFETIIEQEFNGEKIKNKFTIVDYHIIRNKTPKKIYLRIMENEFEEVTIDDTKYTGVFESRLLGIDEAKEEFDELLSKK